MFYYFSPGVPTRVPHPGGRHCANATLPQSCWMPSVASDRVPEDR